MKGNKDRQDRIWSRMSYGFADIYGDCAEELSILARMLGIRSVSYL